MKPWSFNIKHSPFLQKRKKKNVISGLTRGEKTHILLQYNDYRDVGLGVNRKWYWNLTFKTQRWEMILKSNFQTSKMGVHVNYISTQLILISKLWHREWILKRTTKYGKKISKKGREFHWKKNGVVLVIYKEQWTKWVLDCKKSHEC